MARAPLHVGEWRRKYPRWPEHEQHRRYQERHRRDLMSRRWTLRATVSNFRASAASAQRFQLDDLCIPARHT
jgi:hypothetical protein